ncbi:MAG: 50S ribosomal protein L13 [Candidatus Marinimicrobia bacterium]|nr:50S ribosomal protein L13 [Candidatus Neomarinimicrobiota bacterium]|tara:strand:- start:6582 stop:7010 length:429 start_codon:yes stop_codon:yes gene_type:complete
MQTLSIKKEQIERSWFIVDAANQKLGRLASTIAQVIRGKHKPFFTPNLDMGDFVVVINADKITLSGNKSNQKKYWRHTGYPGGQKIITYNDMQSKYPDRIISNAVKGMLPHNKLGRKLLKHLKVYSGANHPHSSQNPRKLEI